MSDANTAMPSWALLALAVLVVVYILWSTLPQLRMQAKRGSYLISKSLLVWGAIIVLALGGYLFRFELSGIRERFQAEWNPAAGLAIAQRDGSISYRSAEDRHYYVQARIGDQAIRMLVDTGASNVVLSKKDAISLGIDLSTIRFTHSVNTANGSTRAAIFRLPEIRLSDSVVVTHVDTMITEGDVGISLLGMSFLSRVGGYSFTDERLLIRPY